MSHSSLSRRIALGALAVAFALALVLGPAPAARAQGAEGYEALKLPQGWEEVRYKDGASIERVEYIFRDRLETLLKIKRLRVTAGQGPEQVAESDLEQTLRFLPGYVRGKTEAFTGGAHAGVFAQFDFTRSGRAMLGRNYYLKGDDSTVWVLQFTGYRDSLGPLRNVTDQIARGFKQSS